jgi:hypothetical protein
MRAIGAQLLGSPISFMPELLSLARARALSLFLSLPRFTLTLYTHSTLSPHPRPPPRPPPPPLLLFTFYGHKQQRRPSFSSPHPFPPLYHSSYCRLAPFALFLHHYLVCLSLRAHSLSLSLSLSRPFLLTHSHLSLPALSRSPGSPLYTPHLIESHD